MLTRQIMKSETGRDYEHDSFIEKNSVEKSQETDKKYNKFRRKRPLYYVTIFYLAVLHILAPFSIYVFFTHFGLINVLWTYSYVFFGGIGITAGAHRLWSHRCYKAKLPLRILLLICYMTTPMHHLSHWVHDHRVHHKYSDTDADPYNAKRGFFFSHIGWLLQKEEHPEVTRRKMETDISDMINDPWIRFQDRHYWIVRIPAYIIPILIPVYLWQESWICAISLYVIRNLIVLHGTLSINSVNHKWGQRPYNKSILPAQNSITNFVSFGEGWHNYHHAFPWDYKASEYGLNYFNVTTRFLNFFAMIGWAYDLKEPLPESVKSYIQKYGDGSHTSISSPECTD